MNKYFMLPFLAVVLFLVACHNPGKYENQPIVVNESNICRKTLSVGGMACVGCEVTIEEKLSRIEGVVSVRASHKSKQVKIEFDSTQTNLSVLKSNLVESGYTLLEK